jgi:hypothetical protein
MVLGAHRPGWRIGSPTRGTPGSGRALPGSRFTCGAAWLTGHPVLPVPSARSRHGVVDAAAAAVGFSAIPPRSGRGPHVDGIPPGHGLRALRDPGSRPLAPTQWPVVRMRLTSVWRPDVNLGPQRVNARCRALR